MLQSVQAAPIPPPVDTCVKPLVITRTFFVVCALWLCLVHSSLADSTGADAPMALTPQMPSPNALLAVCQRFNALNTRIRDNRIGRGPARVELQSLLAELREGYRLSGAVDYPVSSWIFPLAGYDVRAIGPGRRHGYSARGYDFFSGNRHGGHPSFDIFIRDRNQDGRDDRSGQPVSVLSLTGGIVVALEPEWLPDSRLRGGKYLWIYDPANDLLVYYAHNGGLSVGLGDVVKPGDKLATVGRSGYNAAKRRSPTHLHLTVIHIQGDRVLPLDVYQELRRAVRVPVRS